MLTEDPPTLLQLSRKRGITSERVRQIEARAFEKLQKAILPAAAELGLSLRPVLG
jgi:RNA polymerase sigma-32 factor